MNLRFKKTLSVVLAFVIALPLFFRPATASEVLAANNVMVNLSAENQEIRGFGGMNHSVWIGDLTPSQRETAFGNGENQLGLSILRIPIDENRNNWQREVETAKKAIEHGAIVFASPWNPPSEMVETFTMGMSSGTGSTYQAETGTLTNSNVDSANSGYTGTGYVEYQAESDAAIQFNNVIIGSTGTKNIKIRYSLETGTRYLDVYVNGTKALSDVAFEATGSWDSWHELSVQVPMSVGNNNTIKFVTTGTGGPNIDNINATGYIEVPNAKRLKHDMYDDYAQYLNEFDSFMKDNGVELYAISIQNEPDYAHDWTWWSPEEILRFMKENAGSINTRVIAPESFQYVKKMSDPILNDPEALANLDILGAHTYGTSFSDFPYPLFEQKGAGKELWMTEVYYPNSDMTSGDRWPEALSVANHIHHAMADAEFQAYVWWYIRRGYSPIKEDGTISKRGYMMAHYSKFIRPGYIRVEATKNPDPDVFVSAYKGDNKVVIVAVNSGNSAVSENFELQNGNATTVSSWVTDESRNLDAGAPIPVSNSSFTAELPAQSVTTFVAEIVDETAPTTTLTLTPKEPDGLNGWYVNPVTAKLSASDNVLGPITTEYSLDGGNSWKTYTEPLLLDTDEMIELRYRSTDSAGNVEIERESIIQLDTKGPEIEIDIADGETFDNNRVLLPEISVTDALSGTDSTMISMMLNDTKLQAGEEIKLYELPLGTHELIVKASDAAGNVSSVSIHFVIGAHVDSIKALVTLFREQELIGNHGIANSLLKKLDNGNIRSFIDEVKAQRGKHIESKVAEYLLRDAEYLLP